MNHTTIIRWIIHTLVLLAVTSAVSADAIDKRDLVFQIVPFPRSHDMDESTGICLGMIASETDSVGTALRAGIKLGDMSSFIFG